MNKPIAVGVGLLVLVMLLLFSTTFTVKYNEVAIKATFGQTDADGIIRDAGLHYRLPVFIDKVTKLDTRLQAVETPMAEITTRDGLQIVVSAYLLWRVDTDAETGPLDFFRSHASVGGAAQTLRQQFRTVALGAVSRFDFNDLVGENSRLADVETDIRTALSRQIAGEGIKAEAVGINRIMLPPKTSSAVLKRMQATRDALAEEERTTGTSRAERIRADGNSWADKILAFANQRAEEIRAVGEREAAKYYQQMGTDEDLAVFLVHLDALERTFNRNTTIIMDAQGNTPAYILDPAGAEFRNGVPVPAKDGGRPPKVAEPGGVEAKKARDAGAADDLTAVQRPDGEAN